MTRTAVKKIRVKGKRSAPYIGHPYKRSTPFAVTVSNPPFVTIVRFADAEQAEAFHRTGYLAGDHPAFISGLR